MFIRLRNLTKKFKNTIAVNNINFDIEKNKTIGLWAQMVVEKLLQLECYLIDKTYQWTNTNR